MASQLTQVGWELDETEDDRAFYDPPGSTLRRCDYRPGCRHPGLC